MNLAESHQPFLVPKDEIQSRIRGFQTLLKSHDITVAWIDHPTDLSYFTGSIQNGVLFIPAAGDPQYYVKRSLSRAEVESPLGVEPYPGRKSLLKKLMLLLDVHGSLGLPFSIVNAALYRWLNESLDNVNIKDTTLLLLTQKSVKSDWEIQWIQKAADQADDLFSAIPEITRPGMNEIGWSAEMEKRLREMGHSGTTRIRGMGADLCLLAASSGESALYPTNFDGPVGGEGLYPSTSGSGWKTLNPGETAIVDVVTSVNGYHADHSRIYYLGTNIPERAQSAHNFCLDVLRRIESQMKPGANCQEIYQSVQSWVDTQDVPEGFMGYGENRVKFFAHGIGLELDEFPVIANRMDITLQPGNVIAVEPKAFLRGIGPVGIENTYVITENGFRQLSKTDSSIQCI